MKTGRNRHGRKDHSRQGHAARAHLGRWLRRHLPGDGAALPGSGSRSRPRRRPAAPARPLGKRRPPAGGAGLVFSSPMRSAGATWYGPGPLRQRHRLWPDPAAGHDRRRPPHAALRHHGQAHLPRPLPGHQGDRPRPLHAGQRFRPHQRRPPRARLRRRGAGSLRRRRRLLRLARLSRISRFDGKSAPERAGFQREELLYVEVFAGSYLRRAADAPRRFRRQRRRCYG